MNDNVNKAIAMIMDEMGKAILGKNDVLQKVFAAVLAEGNILLDDVPGTGKTTMAIALGKVLGLSFNRIQFTPDVLPSDIVGFSLYDKETGGFVYQPGVVNQTNLLLADEINRTSSKTQSALLEAMEEKQVTVDGNSYPLPKPFLVIATQNQVGAAGTQLLPHAQLDRFLIRTTVGYPDHETQKSILRGHQLADPIDSIRQIITLDSLLVLQDIASRITLSDEIIDYISRLVIATRESNYLTLGISPRGALALSRMSRSIAMMKGRDYVVPEDVIGVFTDVCAHRVLLSQAARSERLTEAEVLQSIVKQVRLPYMV